MLIALHERMGHDEATEREVARGELGKIAALRLAKAFVSLIEPRGAAPTGAR